MNDVDFPVEKVLEGIDAAAAVGFGPIKVNMVVKRGVNEHSVLPMARYFKDRGHILRFIEFMDVGATNGWKMEHVVPSRELVEMINRELADRAGRIRTIAAKSPSAGVIRTAAAKSGFISSVTHAFCRDCTRARLSAEGQLYTCLFATQGTDFQSAVAWRGLGRRDISTDFKGLDRA